MRRDRNVRWTCHHLTARPTQRSFRLVLEPHDGRALAPIPKKSTSPRDDIDTEVVDRLKALDLNRPIREADIRDRSTLLQLQRSYEELAKS